MRSMHLLLSVNILPSSLCAVFFTVFPNGCLCTFYSMISWLSLSELSWQPPLGVHFALVFIMTLLPKAACSGCVLLLGFVITVLLIAGLTSVQACKEVRTSTFFTFSKCSAEALSSSRKTKLYQSFQWEYTEPRQVLDYPCTLLIFLHHLFWLYV